MWAKGELGRGRTWVTRAQFSVHAKYDLDAGKQLISLTPNTVLCVPGKLTLDPPLLSLVLNIQGYDWCNDVGQHSTLRSQTLVVAGAQGCHGAPTNISCFPSPDEIAVAILNVCISRYTCEHPVGRFSELAFIGQCVLVFVFMQIYRIKLAVELRFQVEQQLSGAEAGLPSFLEKCLNWFALWTITKNHYFYRKS